MSSLAVPLSFSPASHASARGIRIHPVCFFLALFALILSLSEGLLNDPDTHWHIAVGRWILETRSVPWTDAFSHTFAGKPWIAKEWLSQLVLYAAFEAGGWRGVTFLAASVIAASFGMLFAWLQRRIHPTAALAVVLAAVGLASATWLARPHILVLPVLILWTGGLVGAVERRSSPSWWLVALMILWANLHGSFPIGYALAGVLGAEALISAPREHRAETALHWGSFLGAIFLAGFATPYGYRAMGVTFGLFGNGESLPYITEWQPLGFDTVGIAADGLLALILVGLSFRPKENLFRILLVALFGYLTFKHGRFISLFVFVVPMLAAEPLVRRFPRWAALGPEQGSGPLSRSATTGLVLAVIGIGLVKAPEPSPRTTPTAAVREARARGIAGPVYNDYDFGGFLIGAGVKTFIDGRTDQLFLDGFIGRWAEAVHAVDARPFAQLLDSHQVAWALVKPGSDEVRHLNALPGWRLAYEDVSAAIYVRN